VEGLTCRLLPYAVADGPHNMAADEVLLQGAAARTASLRFYGWSEATASLGYFQPERVRQQDARVAALPFVRRPSGGATLVHHHEVTYCLALPAGAPWHSGEPWLWRMHRIIAGALAELGVTARLHEGRGATEYATSFLCFHQFTPGDLLIGPAKVVGSAQRKQRGALMQHGAILLAGSPHTPALPGIRELTGRQFTPGQVTEVVTGVFARHRELDLVERPWTAFEIQTCAQIAATRYGTGDWNCRR
jgi:lipoate-protein ligase A